jgi:hypothetical protein
VKASIKSQKPQSPLKELKSEPQTSLEGVAPVLPSNVSLDGFHVVVSLFLRMCMRAAGGTSTSRLRDSGDMAFFENHPVDCPSLVTKARISQNILTSFSLRCHLHKG